MGAKVLQAGISYVVAHFNIGSWACIKTFDKLGISSGEFSMTGCEQSDKITETCQEEDCFEKKERKVDLRNRQKRVKLNSTIELPCSL